MRFAHVPLFALLAALAFGALASPEASAAPDFLNKRTVVSPDGEGIWEVFPDSTRPEVFYRLPDMFEVGRDSDGQRAVSARFLGNGTYRLEFAWSVRDWTKDSDAIRAQLTAETGREPVIAVAHPRFVRLTPDPELFDVFGAKMETLGLAEDFAPSAKFLSRIDIPAGKAAAFRNRLVGGNGFSHLLEFELEYDDGLGGGAGFVHPFSLAFFLGGLNHCEVVAGLTCGGVK